MLLVQVCLGNTDPSLDGFYELVSSGDPSPGQCVNDCMYQRKGDTEGTIFCFASSETGQAPCVEGEQTGEVTSAGLPPPTSPGCPRHSIVVDCSGQPDLTYYADPTNCGNFYQCDHGVGVQKSWHLLE